MSTTPVTSYYADFGGLESLKKTARQDEASAVRSAARQFESLFTNMLLKSMREANLGEGLGDSEGTDFYQGMFDQQLSVQLSQGKGLGLADMLVQQLTRTGLVKGTASTATASAAASGAGATQSPQSTSGGATTALNFVQQLLPDAQRVAAKLGVAPEAIVAQAALETGWGTRMPTDASGAASNNLFGIKAGSGWSGGSVQATTTEYDAGGAQSVTQPFRAYASQQQSVEDYARLLQNSPRYAGALAAGNDVAAFARGLQDAGYATDPDYARKLTAVAGSVRSMLTGISLKSAGAVPTQSQDGTA